MPRPPSERGAPLPHAGRPARRAARFLFLLAAAAVPLAAAFFLPVAALAWFLGRERLAVAALCLVPAIPLAAAASGLLVLALGAASRRR
ncbi:MAG TPA: hypothetical protein VMT17_15940 [Anaeromyxobacteraceae bacterium]|nr:hypothetical protein [Anaeromyxobacteraceae bacterium]